MLCLTFTHTSAKIKNHLPFSISEELLQLVQTVSQGFDPKLIERSHISNTTITNIVSDCIAACLREQLLEELKDSYFSILVDESSDLYGGAYIGLHVRYINEQCEIPIIKLISIIELVTESTGEALFDKIKADIFSYNPKLKDRVIGLCTDNASNMVSPKDKGLFNRLNQEIPHLIHMRDICHCFNLVCKAALNDFPQYIINFARDICSHFGRSAQRRAQLIEIQKLDGCKEPLGVLKFIETRWLSLQQCTSRILIL